jgi:hypothetical protein
VASLQDGLVGGATALSPALPGHFKFLFHQLFVGLGLKTGLKRWVIVELIKSKFKATLSP